ncbi:hypothetical protein PANDA_020842 [Ailuropoda melanoleuca]|uniref:C-type lectin domain-containing protein n=1 Tax=Ailuropoda melanoleuca TaxID=9646 RepID=D2I5A2_AILME|nr:hypothetical protein PANDA_020842 [Ailuropoda melanoleuca]
MYMYTNSGCQDLPGTRDEEDGDDYENMAPPYKDLPPKPGKKMENPPLPCKSPKIKGLDRNPVSRTSPQLGVNLEPPPFQPSPAITPVSQLSRKSMCPGCYQEERLVVYLCMLVVVSLVLGCTGLAVTLIKLTGMAGIAGLKKDIDHIRTNTNQSLLELRGLLDCTRVTCPEGWLPFEGKCYYFSSTTKSWDEARKSCQENYSHLVIISSFAEQVIGPFQALESQWDSQIFPWPGWREIGIAFESLRLLTVSFWDPEEPNNIFDEDCASMNKGGTWNDLSCDKSTYWICERKCSC